MSNFDKVWHGSKKQSLKGLGWFLGSNPKRGQSPGELGEILYVCPSVNCPSVCPPWLALKPLWLALRLFWLALGLLWLALERLWLALRRLLLALQPLQLALRPHRLLSPSSRLID